ncbi:MAG: CTP synthetase, partial [Thaumarchaeota archaeon]|nr:CTP synthetase [Nitrososphaerota archaeon]
QLAAVAFGRYVCGLSDANSTEINPNTENPVIDLLPEQKFIENKGGSLRLGANEIKVDDSTLGFKLYKSATIFKRHRHRYEFNQKYLELFNTKGLRFSGYSDNKKRMEILEIPNHKFYLGVQFHPEFSSRPGYPEESFEAFIRAASSA